MEINPLNNQQQYNCNAENHNAQTKDVNFGAQPQRGTSSQNSISNSQISAATRGIYLKTNSKNVDIKNIKNHLFSAKIDKKDITKISGGHCYEYYKNLYSIINKNEQQIKIKTRRISAQLEKALGTQKKLGLKYKGFINLGKGDYDCNFEDKYGNKYILEMDKLGICNIKKFNYDKNNGSYETPQNINFDKTIEKSILNEWHDIKSINHIMLASLNSNASDYKRLFLNDNIEIDYMRTEPHYDNDGNKTEDVIILGINSKKKVHFKDKFGTAQETNTYELNIQGDYTNNNNSPCNLKQSVKYSYWENDNYCETEDLRENKTVTPKSELINAVNEIINNTNYIRHPGNEAKNYYYTYTDKNGNSTEYLVGINYNPVTRDKYISTIYPIGINKCLQNNFYKIC